MTSDPNEPIRGGAEPGAGTQLGEGTAAARASATQMLKDALEQMEREKREAFRTAEERLGRAVDRVDEALVRLGVERGELRADLERRISNAIEQLSTEVGERLGRAEVRLEEHARRLGAGEMSHAAERREIEEAVGKVRASIEDASQTVARAADLERRMEAAVRREAEAAERIARAERRIQGLVEDSPPREGPQAERD